MANHLIFGAGLIGGYMAGAFASRGERVSVVGRESMRARFSNTFTVTDYLEHRADLDGIRFLATANEANEPFDFVWLTVKSTGLQQALVDVRPFISSETTIFACQNGLGSDVLIQCAYPSNKVLRAIMQPNVAQLSESHLHRGSEGSLFVQSCMLNGRELAEQISTPLLPCEAIDNIEAFAWAKLQLNIANAVNALANVPVKQMLEESAYRKVISACMRELLSVCRARNLALPKIAAVPMHFIPTILSLPNWAFAIVGKKMMDIDPTVRTSMWWDLSHGRTTEVDFLNGTVVQEGNSLGLDCPVNAAIVELVHAVERGERQQGIKSSELLKLLAL